MDLFIPCFRTRQTELLFEASISFVCTFSINITDLSLQLASTVWCCQLQVRFPGTYFIVATVLDVPFISYYVSTVSDMPTANRTWSPLLEPLAACFNVFQANKRRRQVSKLGFCSLERKKNQGYSHNSLRCLKEVGAFLMLFF